MARRASSSRGRSSGSRGFSGSRISSGRSFSGGFKSSSTRHYGSHYTRHRPYRRNYFFHKLGPAGKVVYFFVMIFLWFVIAML